MEYTDYSASVGAGELPVTAGIILMTSYGRNTLIYEIKMRNSTRSQARSLQGLWDTTRGKMSGEMPRSRCSPGSSRVAGAGCIWNEGLGEAGGGVGFAFHQQLSHSCTRKEENPKISLKNLSSPLWGLCLFLTKAIRIYMLFFIPKQQYKALHKCLDKCLLVLQS